jgi:organic radical activating enzyme
MFYLSEIFRGIQFEGARCGTPALFIRFHGCDLQCPFCDTLYAREGKGWPLDGEGLAQIIKQSAPLKTVVLTGGEPTIQPLVTELASLLSEKLTVCIETNGTRPDVIKDLCEIIPDLWITFSPKSFKDAEKIYEPMWELANEIKVIYGSLSETLLARAAEEGEKGTLLFMQPMEREGVIEWEPVVQFVGEYPEWRMSFQIHKMLGLK